MNKLILFIALVMLVLGLGARHQNSQTLHSLGETLVAADAAGTDVTAPLQKAQNFAASHMSSPLRIILKASFDRAVEQAKAAAAPSTNNMQVYAQAQAACAGKADSVTQAKCNQDYLAKHLAPATAPTPVPQPKLADYTHEIRSPLWTPDLAGFSLVLATLAGVVGLVASIRRKS